MMNQEEKDDTCIICLDAKVKEIVICCNKPICKTCWDNSTKNSHKCPHCRKIYCHKYIHDDILNGNGISNHTVIIGNPFEETIVNMLIWNANQILPATNWANYKIKCNGNHGNICIKVIEDTINHIVIDKEERVERNIIYYHF
jgi:hypothetical protein